MSTDTLYNTANWSGWESKNAVYATARSGGGIFTAHTDYALVGAEVPGNYFCYESFIEFDLTAYSSGGTASAPTLSGWPAFTPQGTFNVNAYDDDYGTSATSADWQAGSINTLRAHIASSVAQLAYRDFTDDAMTAAIQANLGGYLRLILVSSNQVSNTAPGVGVPETLYFDAITNKMRLVFTYDPPVSGDPMGMMGFFG